MKNIEIYYNHKKLFSFFPHLVPDKRSQPQRWDAQPVKDSIKLTDFIDVQGTNIHP